MKDIPKYVDCSYYKYSDWGYKKQTRLWTNLDWQPKVCNTDCQDMITPTKHKYTAQRGPGFPGDRFQNYVLDQIQELHQVGDDRTRQPHDTTKIPSNPDRGREDSRTHVKAPKEK